MVVRSAEGPRDHTAGGHYAGTVLYNLMHGPRLCACRARVATWRMFRTLLGGRRAVKAASREYSAAGWAMPRWLTQHHNRQDHRNPARSGTQGAGRTCRVSAGSPWFGRRGNRAGDCHLDQYKGGVGRDSYVGARVRVRDARQQVHAIFACFVITQMAIIRLQPRPRGHQSTREREVCIYSGPASAGILVQNTARPVCGSGRGEIATRVAR